MIFLIEYDRSNGQLRTLSAFADEGRSEAEDARLQLELGLNRQGIEREVVLLEAESEDALRRTHRRYFEDAEALSNAPPSNRKDR